jgi:hypothetical protein
MDAARTTPASGHSAARIRRGARRALTVGVLVPAVALAVAAPAFAAVTAVQGSAYGVNVDLSGLVNVDVGPTPESTIPGTGGTDTDTVANVALTGIGGVGVVTTSSTGTVGAGGTVTSSAEVANANIGRTGLSLLTASVINSRCTSDESGSSGSSTITGLQVLGQPVTVTGSPNQTVTVNLGIASVIVHINEQISTGTAPSSSITVNALRLEVSAPPVATGSVTIAQSVCGVTGDAVGVPTGAIGGVLLTGLAAVGFVGFQFSRRRRGSVQS